MKKLVIIVLMHFLIVSLGFTQNSKDFLNENFAQFKGGDNELHKYIVENTKYPKNAKQYCISGKVYVKFIVDSLGNLNTVEALNSLGYGCDEEAVRVIKSTTGKWKPGIKNNKPINIAYKIPIRFEANENCLPFYFEYLEAGDKLFEKDKYHKAIIEYNKILEISPYNPDALFKRGLSKLSISDTAGACYDWNKIPKVLNDKAKAYLLKYCD